MSEDTDTYGLPLDTGASWVDSYDSSFYFPVKKKRRWLKKLGFFIIGIISGLAIFQIISNLFF